MKKVMALLLCIGFLFASATIAFADVSHFEDGHKTKVFDDYGISLEIPSDWKDRSLKGAFAFFPDDVQLYHDTASLHQRNTS